MAPAPTKPGYAVFTTELLVDGKNSGMFVQRELFGLLKKFYAEANKPEQFAEYVRLMIEQIVSTAFFEVDADTLASFIANEIKNAK
jgi:hypothetical protein